MGEHRRYASSFEAWIDMWHKDWTWYFDKLRACSQEDMAEWERLLDDMSGWSEEIKQEMYKHQATQGEPGPRFGAGLTPDRNAGGTPVRRPPGDWGRAAKDTECTGCGKEMKASRLMFHTGTKDAVCGSCVNKPQFDYH